MHFKETYLDTTGKINSKIKEQNKNRTLILFKNALLLMYTPYQHGNSPKDTKGPLSKFRA